jgi:hypothetical protein
MPRKRINLSEILPPTWTAVHTTASGRKGATRWMIYDGEDNYQGDLVRWRGDWNVRLPSQEPGESWSWQPYNSEDPGVVEGTVNQCSEAIFDLDGRER